MYLTEDQEKEVTKIEKALIRDGREDFVLEMKRADISQLEAKLLELAKHAQEIQNTKDRDDELIQARRKKSDLEAPYREQTRYNKKLARFVALTLKDEEGDLNGDTLESSESAQGAL